MNNINLEQIKPLLTDVSQKLGQGADFTWEAVYRQQFIDGIINIIGIFIGIAILYGAYRCYLFTKNKDRYSDDTHIVMLGYISLFIGFFLIITSIIGAIDHLANPEYQAILDLIKLIN